MKVIRLVAIAATIPVSMSLAYAFYPHDHPQNASSDVFDLTYNTDTAFVFGMDANSLDIELAMGPRGGTTIRAYGPPTPFDVAATTSAKAWGSPTECGGLPRSACSTFGLRKSVTFPQAERTHTAEMVSALTIPAVENEGGYPTTNSGGYASVQLPSIHVEDNGWDYQGVNPAANIPVVVDIRVPGWEKYSWSGGPEPGAGATSDEMSFLEVTDVTGGIPSVIESGVSLSQQHAETTRTLIAGALIGLVGAAIIAFLQEIRREDADRETPGRRRRRQPEERHGK